MKFQCINATFVKLDLCQTYALRPRRIPKNMKFGYSAAPASPARRLCLPRAIC